MKYFNELLILLNEMSPYLILGFFISGLLHVYVPRKLYARYLQRKGFRSVALAAVLGIPLPLCSCGVIPTAVSLKKEGASDGAAVSFLVATPQTGVDSILATYSLLGLPFAILRPLSSFVVALVGGMLVDLYGNKTKPVSSPFANMSYAPKSVESGCGCGCGSSSSPQDQKQEKSFVAALRYGFVDMMQDFSKWLLIGLLVAAAITTFVPESVFVLFKEYYFLNILLILLISAPMYICATGSIPIALSLMLKGVSPGAAFVLLMAGPATNFASLLILRKEIGARKTIIYISSIIIGSIACALVIDFVLPTQWFSSLSSPASDTHSHAHAHGSVWWQSAMSVIFVALFINAVYRNWQQRNKKSCCK